MFGLSISLLVLLLLFSGGCSEEWVLQDGNARNISCKPKETGQMVWWFRLKDNEMLEFIGAFTILGATKTTVDDKKFSYDQITKNILTLKAFNKKEDSGSYICMAMKGSMLHFGKVTKLRGPPDQVPEITVIPTTRAKQFLTDKPTVSCEKSGSGKTSFSVAAALGCELVILIPMAVGSGLLLILLIITIIYCNSIRTRRCPHHYKRHPQNRPAGPARPLPNKTEFYPL